MILHTIPYRIRAAAKPLPPTPPSEPNAKVAALTDAQQASRAKRTHLRLNDKKKRELQTGRVQDPKQARGIAAVLRASEDAATARNVRAAVQPTSKPLGSEVLVPATAITQKNTMQMQVAASVAAASIHPIIQNAKTAAPATAPKSLSAIQQKLQSKHGTVVQGESARNGTEAPSATPREHHRLLPARDIFDRCQFRIPGHSDVVASRAEVAEAGALRTIGQEMLTGHPSESGAATNWSAVPVGPTISGPSTDLSRVLVNPTESGYQSARGLADLSDSIVGHTDAAEVDVAWLNNSPLSSNSPPMQYGPFFSPSFQAPPPAQGPLHASEPPSSDYSIPRSSVPIQRTSNAYEGRYSSVSPNRQVIISSEEPPPCTPDASQIEMSMGPTAPLTTLLGKTEHAYGGKPGSRPIRKLSKRDQLEAPRPGQVHGSAGVARSSSMAENEDRGRRSEMSPKRRRL